MNKEKTTPAIHEQNPNYESIFRVMPNGSIVVLHFGPKKKAS